MANQMQREMSRSERRGRDRGPAPLWRRSSGRALILTGCCTVLLALLPTAGMAAPEGDATFQVDSFTVAANGDGDGQAFCPAGTRVVGGGVTSTGAPTAYVRVSGPLDETGLTSNLNNGDVGRSWYANVHNDGAQNTFVSTAICSKNSDATLRVDPYTINTTAAGDGQAFCPAGSRVIGGGVTSTGAVNARIQVSGPLDETGLTSNLNNGDVGRSWYANHFNVSGNSTFVSTAICSPASDATLRVDSFTLAAPGGESGDGQAFCPAGTRVVGGGITSTGAANGGVQVSGPLDETGLTSNLSNGDVGQSWYANFFGLPGTFVSTAICAPPTSTTEDSVQTCKGKKATIARPGVLGRKLSGTPNADVIVGTPKKDKINAGKGNDLVCAGKGKDLVKGGKGKDGLYGQGGRDTLLGQGGADLLSGGGKRDNCVGGAGNDSEKSC